MCHPHREQAGIQQLSNTMTSTTTALNTLGPLPITTPPTEVCLRGACGPGFGRGQMLARMHLRDRNAPLVVERAFLPSTIHSDFTTHPFAWQTKPFEPELTSFKDWTYVIIEVAVDSVSPAIFQIENLDGTPVQSAWQFLDLTRFRLDEETGYKLAVLTGLQYRRRNYKQVTNKLKNFQDADDLDTCGWRPKVKPAVDPIDADIGWRRTPVAPAPAPAPAETKITIDAGPDGKGINAFLARSFQGEKIQTRVNIAEAPKPQPAARPRQQHKPVVWPQRPPTPLPNGLHADWGKLNE